MKQFVTGNYHKICLLLINLQAFAISTRAIFLVRYTASERDNGCRILSSETRLALDAIRWCPEWLVYDSFISVDNKYTRDMRY